MNENNFIRPCILNAVYRPQEIPEYANNPLIEALPRILTAKEWASVLTHSPVFCPEELEEDAHRRQHFVFRLRGFHQPLPESVELAMTLDQMLRQGYLHRNPATPDRACVLQNIYARVQSGELDNGSFSDTHPIISSSLAGVSGMGKTTTVEMITDTYPQVLYHPDYGIHQIVWLKVNCPHNGDPRLLARAIIMEVDRIMGTRFIDELSSKPNDADLWRMVVHLAAVYSIGMILIDEVQNLSARRSGSWEIMLNYFQELCNQLKIPILVTGTMKAARIYQYDFRHARRNAAVGAFVWDRLECDYRWEFLLKSMWRYQWVKKPIPLTPEMSKILFDMTQGIIAVVTVMFLLAQRRAIDTGEEELSENLFKRVLEKELAPMHKMLAALRSGNPARIKKYEDLQPIDFDQLLEREEQRMLMGSLKKAASRPIGELSIEDKAIATLVTSGIPQDKAELMIAKAAEGGRCKTSAGLVTRASRSMIEQAGDMEDLGDVGSEAFDLRKIDGSNIDDMEQCGLVGDLPEQ